LVGENNMNLCDLVVPVASKDCDGIENKLDNFREYTGIKKCYIITNARLKISDGDTIVVDENDLKIPNVSFFSNLPYKTKGRGKWLFQQFCKLSICESILDISEKYLVVDSDLVFCNEYKPYFSKSDFYAPVTPHELHVPYLHAVNKILGLSPVMIENKHVSFVSHQMLFNKSMCNNMLKHIENIHTKNWCEAIIGCLDFNENSNMSEWDLYANYCLQMEPSKSKINNDLVWMHDCNGGIPSESEKEKITYYADHKR
tara:strand:+ start:113 stop:883 length:771 start_codon:yes stop_codon:yes gene_type:complete